MNIIEKKFCFITCVNDDNMYKEALYYISRLHIPEGYTVECFALYNAESMANGYNIGMIRSDSKYKIYIHQDTHIINSNFLTDILSIFTSDTNIGMIGVVGSQFLPSSGMWWKSPSRFGGVYQTANDRTYLNFFGVPNGNSLGYAKAIDGVLMATQFDLPWRSDLFDNWHIYDISQSLEFLQKKFNITVPCQVKNGQIEPWVMHVGNNGEMNIAYLQALKILLTEYGTELDVFPEDKGDLELLLANFKSDVKLLEFIESTQCAPDKNNIPT